MEEVCYVYKGTLAYQVYQLSTETRPRCLVLGILSRDKLLMGQQNQNQNQNHVSWNNKLLGIAWESCY
jgi:hypothetical protein